MRSSHDPNPTQGEDHTRDDFTETCWTAVGLAGGHDGSASAQQALEGLCARYWTSIYSFLRRKGHRPSDAEDLTQSFFIGLIEENAFARAHPSRGRFRNFLLGALERFLADQGRWNRAQKRGGGQVMLSLDFRGGERCYLEEADPGLTPEQTYDRRWAATVLETAFGHLQAEFRQAGQVARFEDLKRFLSEEASEGDYEALAGRLGITRSAVGSAICRLRERYRELVQRTVLATVAGPAEMDKEFLELFR